MTTIKPEEREEVARGVYVASRASVLERGAMWRRLRAEGAPIVSTWIDEDGENDTADLDELWVRINREVTTAKALILYVEPEDFPLKGAFVEVGMAIAAAIPIFVVAPRVEISGRNQRPFGSWCRHPSVSFCETVEGGFAKADAILSRRSTEVEGERVPLTLQMARAHADMWQEAIARAEAAEASVSRLTAELEGARGERDEAVNWGWVVDRHGTDCFDALAEKWLSQEGVRRMHNAVSSVFSKWANDELLQRFKDHMSTIMQQSFVEGCLAGVRAEAVESAVREQAAEAQVQRLQGALEPFAEMATRFLYLDEDERVHQHTAKGSANPPKDLTVADFRRARAALSETAGKGNGSSMIRPIADGPRAADTDALPDDKGGR